MVLIALDCVVRFGDWDALFENDDRWDFSEWTIPEIESESISLLIKKL